MFHVLEKRIGEAFAARIKTLYDVEAPVQTEQPKQAAFGEIAVPAAFQLARQLKKAPAAIAKELLAGAAADRRRRVDRDRRQRIFERPSGSRLLRLESAGRRRRGAYAASRQNHRRAHQYQSQQSRPHRAPAQRHPRRHLRAHAAHRRPQSGSAELHRQYRRAGGRRGSRISASGDFSAGSRTQQPFDYLCWDLYAAVSAYYEGHKEALEWRRNTLHAIESGHGPEAEKAHEVSDRIVHAHLATMWRLNIVYDVLPRESEILHLKFWATAFELLRQRKAIYLETEGKNKGCWVMPGSAFREGQDSDEEDSKVIVRSNGTVTYVGKDIAYQLWKFGLLGKDFHYRKWHTYPNGHVAWSTDSGAAGRPAAASASGSKVYNVIDSRQSYLQDVVVAGLRALGFERQAEASIHFSYEMVALTPRTCVGSGHPAFRGRQEADLRGGLRTQGARRQGRRSDRQAD